jgi:hypothetical protein
VSLRQLRCSPVWRWVAASRDNRVRPDRKATQAPKVQPGRKALPGLPDLRDLRDLLAQQGLPVPKAPLDPRGLKATPAHRRTQNRVLS